VAAEMYGGHLERDASAKRRLLEQEGDSAISEGVRARMRFLLEETGTSKQVSEFFRVKLVNGEEVFGPHATISNKLSA
jgi:hypothetical protein